LALLPLATAAAQELPRLRVTRPDTIRAMRYNTSDTWRLTRTDAGAVFEFIAVDGDQQRYLESNYYLVVLPRDQWGTQWVGWISGRSVEMAPPRPQVTAAPPMPMAAAVAAPRAVDVPLPEPVAVTRTTPAATPLPTMTATTRLLPEIVLRFAFDRSDLSEAAKDSLATALTTMRAEGGSLSFALGGHADAIGPDTYNQNLGLARAETVRQYIVEQLQIPAERISVSSHGETQPVAPNNTPAGRAENRRVVVTVTAAAPIASR
jgi:outer membrane protein OmpA-like peptidoglycan-associated protein